MFKLIINKLNNKEHLISEGLQEIVNICASMNLGLSSTNKKNFPSTIPIVRPLVENAEVPHSQWMAGFVSGEGSFSINTSIQAENKSVSLSFRVSQHVKDEELLKSFVNYFGCGKSYYHDKDKNAVTFVVRAQALFEDINHNIIPFFSKYNIIGVKGKDFIDWCKAGKIIQSKDHLCFARKKDLIKYLK